MTTSLVDSTSMVKRVTRFVVETEVILDLQVNQSHEWEGNINGD